MNALDLGLSLLLTFVLHASLLLGAALPTVVAVILFLV